MDKSDTHESFAIENTQGSLERLKRSKLIDDYIAIDGTMETNSIVAATGNPGQTNYAASKAGIIGFTKACAREMAPRGITVNAVSPGFIQTDITDELTEELKQDYISRIPMNRFGTTDDVAGAVSFLASDDASYVTGEVFRINGGIYT